MVADPEKGVVTDFMLGTMIVFGADIIMFVGIAWIAGFLPAAIFVVVTLLVISVYAAWIVWRWREIKKFESSERSPVEELKYQYVNGEISEEEFEHKLNKIIDNSTLDDRKHEKLNPPQRNENNN